MNVTHQQVLVVKLFEPVVGSVGYVRLQILYEVVLKKMDEIRNVLIGLKLVQNSREQFIPDFVLIVILEPDKGAYQNCRVHYEFMLFRLLCTCLF